MIRRPLDLASLGSAGGVLLLTPAFDRAYHGRIANPAGYTIRVRAVGRAAGDRSSGADLRQGSQLPTARPRDRERRRTRRDQRADRRAVDLRDRRRRRRCRRDRDRAEPRARVLATGPACAARARHDAPPTHGDERCASDRDCDRRCVARRRPARIAASPLLPFGVARRADPDPGLHADWQVLVTGRAGRRRGGAADRGCRGAPFNADRLRATAASGRRSGLASSARSPAAGLSPAATTGLRMATEPGSGDYAVPLRSAAFGAAFGVFGLERAHGLRRESRPSVVDAAPVRVDVRLQVGDDQRPALRRHRPRASLDFPGVASLAVACYENMQFAGRPIIGWGLVPVKGALGPAIVAGRAPQTPNEVALGAATMHALAKRDRRHRADRGTERSARHRADRRPSRVPAAR